MKRLIIKRIREAAQVEHYFSPHVEKWRKFQIPTILGMVNAEEFVLYNGKAKFSSLSNKQLLYFYEQVAIKRRNP